MPLPGLTHNFQGAHESCFLVKSTAPLGSLHFLYFVADFWQGFLVAFATYWTSMLCEGISMYASHGEQLNSLCVLIPSFHLLHYLNAFWLKFTFRVFLTYVHGAVFSQPTAGLRLQS